MPLNEFSEYIDDSNNRIEYTGKTQQNVTITLEGCNNTIIADKNTVLNNCSIKFTGDNSTIIFEQCRLNRCFIWVSQGSYCFFGKGTTSTSGPYILSYEGSRVTIGEDCMFAKGNEIRASDAHPFFDVITGKRINIPRDITIGNHVWLGERAVVLGGSEICDGSIIGMCSIVKGFIPNNCTAAGIPAKVLRKNIAWERPHLGKLTGNAECNLASDVYRSAYWKETV